MVRVKAGRLRVSSLLGALFVALVLAACGGSSDSDEAAVGDSPLFGELPDEVLSQVIVSAAATPTPEDEVLGVCIGVDDLPCPGFEQDPGSYPQSRRDAIREACDRANDDLAEANLVFSPRETMIVGQPNLIRAVLTRETDVDASVVLPDADAGQVTQLENVSCEVEATLSGIGFSVAPEGRVSRILLANGSVDWEWDVVPIETGAGKKLRLVIESRLDASRRLLVQNASVEIDVTVDPVEDATGQWLQRQANDVDLTYVGSTVPTERQTQLQFQLTSTATSFDESVEGDVLRTIVTLDAPELGIDNETYEQDQLVGSQTITAHFVIAGRPGTEGEFPVRTTVQTQLLRPRGSEYVQLFGLTRSGATLDLPIRADDPFCLFCWWRWELLAIPSTIAASLGLIGRRKRNAEADGASVDTPPPTDRGLTTEEHTDQRSLVVLVVASNPADEHRLETEEEIQALERAISESEFADRIVLEILRNANSDEFVVAVREHNPTVIHFCGHSVPGYLIMHDAEDPLAAADIDADGLRRLFQGLRDSNLRVLVLNSCESKDIADTLHDVVPAVICATEEVDDSDARIFGPQFLGALAKNDPLLDAFESGRAVIDLRGGGDGFLCLVDDDQREMTLFDSQQ